jgi:uncharacterized RDD family membrane protein YckC
LDLSTMSATQRSLLPLDEVTDETEAAAASPLKEQVAQRLAAHRARRTYHSDELASAAARSAPSNSRSARIAAAVAERYAHSQSYRAFLAEQAETAIREAQAAAEVAALSAEAVADAQYQLLAELDQWNLAPPEPGQSQAAPQQDAQVMADTVPQARSVTPPTVSGLTVRHYDDDPLTRSYPQQHLISNRTDPSVLLDEPEALALDEEIAFRQAPVFDEVTSPIDIPANLIQFPRQLVAPRKARPRLAEGPLREDADKSACENPDTAQLRIFEVETSQISSAPAVESAAPEWSSILLPAQPVSAVVQEVPEAPFQPALSPQAARFNLRLMAAVVDSCIVASALLAFLTVAALTVDKLSAGNAAANHMTPLAAGLTIAAVFIVFTLLYQLLFFTFSDATPGMRYARIGLCTLSDENPTRAAMRRRIFATVLAACPLGIGFLWAWFDEDGMGWHDRISHMYQRSY